MQLGRGTFRFITGSQDKRNYQIVTPVATIGVRGTIFHVLNDGTQFVVVLQEGAVTLTFPNGNVITIDQPGFAVTVLPDGTITGPSQWVGNPDDPFGVGWQQFADSGNPATTGATPQTFVVNINDTPTVVTATPCDAPTCS
jgi:hypothetical protein